jgi:MFS family permease
VLGAPLILFAKSIGASSTAIGVMASFTPLVMVLQLPATRFLPIFGYKKFMATGWGLRSLFLLLIAAVPLMSFLDNPSKLIALTGALFIFNVLRAMATAAWMPWLASIIPDSEQAEFFSRDHMFLFGGSLVSLCASAVVVMGDPGSLEYALVFLLSAMAGFVSVWFISRIPEPPPEEIHESSMRGVPWKHMLLFPPFLGVLVFNVYFLFVVGSLGVFSVEYLHEIPDFTVSSVLYLSGLSFVGSLFVLSFLGPNIKRLGTKPVIMGAMLLFCVVIGGWFLVASGVLACSHAAIGLLNLLAGAAGAAFNAANARLVFGSVPPTGRTHFFALFTMLTQLGMGVSPVTWGLMLDFIGTFEMTTGAFSWHRHSFYFGTLFFLALPAVALAGILREPVIKTDGKQNSVLPDAA